ncbi:putative E3 ubiquitin-protein ligase RHC1A, partial [Mucuna pruriens]
MEATNWCYSCLQPIEFGGMNDSACPYCNDIFVPQPSDLQLIMEQRGSEARNWFTDAVDNLMRHTMCGAFIIRFGVIARPGSSLFPELAWGACISLFYGNGLRFGNRLQDFMEQDNANHQLGASQSSIDAIPTIEITYEHLNNYSKCPVCMERFEVGCEARKMPCDHIYHSDCIVQWLVRHNSCPVCRVELPPQGNVSFRGERNDDGGSDNNDVSREAFTFLHSINDFIVTGSSIVPLIGLASIC